MSDDVTFRPATQRDFLAFYGRPSPYTLRAMVAEHEGRVIGFGGYYTEPGGALIAFTDILPEMRKHRKAMLRGAKLVMGLIRGNGVPVLARANPNEPTADTALRHFGFAPLGGGFYELVRD